MNNPVETNVLVASSSHAVSLYRTSFLCARLILLVCSRHAVDKISKDIGVSPFTEGLHQFISCMCFLYLYCCKLISKVENISDAIGVFPLTEGRVSSVAFEILSTA